MSFTPLQHPISVAPMMDRTDRHFRAVVRLISRRTLLYTEMVTTGAILHGDRGKLLGFDPAESPLVLQVGGDDPAELRACARIAADLGFDGLNLNVGCPSERVARGNFGACLMAEPERVARCLEALASAGLPVSVKHRLGIVGPDEPEPEPEALYQGLVRFVDAVAASGCRHFVVHARIAVLGGLTPRQNRTVPPLRHDLVHRLAAERPALRVETNGGVTSLAQVEEHLGAVAGVMIGRAVYDDPFLLADADRRLYGDPGAPPSRGQVLSQTLDALQRHVDTGGRPHEITRHLGGLFTGQPGSRSWRRLLADVAQGKAGLPELRAWADALRETAAA